MKGAKLLTSGDRELSSPKIIASSPKKFVSSPEKSKRLDPLVLQRPQQNSNLKSQKKVIKIIGQGGLPIRLQQNTGDNYQVGEGMMIQKMAVSHPPSNNSSMIYANNLPIIKPGMSQSFKINSEKKSVSATKSRTPIQRKGLANKQATLTTEGFEEEIEGGEGDTEPCKPHLVQEQDLFYGPDDDDDDDDYGIDADSNQSDQDEIDTKSPDNRLFKLKEFSISPKKKTSSTSISGDPVVVAEQMLMRKERKIPSSVLKPHADQMYFVVTNYSSIQSVRLFFPYPKYCQTISGASFLKVSTGPTLNEIQKLQMHKQSELRHNNMSPGFKIHESTHIYNAVVNTFKTAGIRIVAPGSYKWNVMWTAVTKPDMLKDASKYQKFNHFPNSAQLGRKDQMWKNIFKMKKMFGSEMDICPNTYIFPDDFRRFNIEREQENYKHMYIMKPSASSCGKGIKIIGQRSQVNKKQGYVVSQYVANPHLLDGFKYDLRIYVLVTSFDPLKVYIFKEGLVRFATEKYSNNPKNLKKRYIHLTNYSVNKKSEGFVQNQGNQGEGDGTSKWNLALLKAAFEKEGINYSQVFGRIKDLVIKSLLCVEQPIVSTMSRCTKYRNQCFEIFGFDVLLDNKLKPWLLEVNTAPSLSSSSLLDKKIKTMLICDALNLVGVVPYDRKEYEKETEQLMKKRLLGLDRKARPPSQSTRKGKREFVAEDLDENERDILLQFEEEQFRLGNFERIFPNEQNIGYYSQFFEQRRNGNEILWRHLRGT